jgi:hypothetical protein
MTEFTKLGQTFASAINRSGGNVNLLNSSQKEIAPTTRKAAKLLADGNLRGTYK